VLAADLLVIGRQVQTDFGGIIDLLCIEPDGALVVVELKRDKTPREITAQCLDYGSWVQNLTGDAVGRIAAAYLGNMTLEEAFHLRFKQELPETINENHRMLVVASRIDPSSERTIKYLNTTYGVDINAVTFHHFKTKSGQELLGRVFLVDPGDVRYQTQTKRSSKRRPNLTYEELENLAETNGVGELYRLLVQGLELLFGKHTTRSSLCFAANLDDSRRTVFSLIPGESDTSHGLYFQVYIERLKKMFDLSHDEAVALLPQTREPWIYSPGSDPGMSGFQGYFTKAEEYVRFIDGLSARPGTA
jgi:hypothetical protein